MGAFASHAPSATPALTLATQKLLHRFSAQRPVRAGSLLTTIFGDAIAPRGGVITLGSLIELSAPFGLTERLVRTSVARLAKDGWLVARRDGRLSEYRLTPEGESRFEEATQRIYGEAPASWKGQWTLIVLTPGRSQNREKLRAQLRWRGFGYLSPGVFAHPNSSIDQVRDWLGSLDDARDAIVFKSSSDAIDVDRKVAGAGWDLGELARRYSRFVAAFSPVETALKVAMPQGTQTTTADSAAAFIIRTLLIHDYRKIHLQDPLLPPVLLPDEWIGSSAYELCRKLYAKVFRAAEQHLSSKACTLIAPLMPADRSAYSRFGGVLSRDGLCTGVKATPSKI
jgi:phenylacetic acid degradation operon negative regulatory protein